MSPEQFNKLATKEDYNKFKKKIIGIGKKIDKINDTLNFLIKKYG